jgi:hypothetical protein
MVPVSIPEIYPHDPSGPRRALTIASSWPWIVPHNTTACLLAPTRCDLKYLSHRRPLGNCWIFIGVVSILVDKSQLVSTISETTLHERQLKNVTCPQCFRVSDRLSVLPPREKMIVPIVPLSSDWTAPESAIGGSPWSSPLAKWLNRMSSLGTNYLPPQKLESTDLFSPEFHFWRSPQWKSITRPGFNWLWFTPTFASGFKELSII